MQYLGFVDPRIYISLPRSITRNLLIQHQIFNIQSETSPKTTSTSLLSSLFTLDTMGCLVSKATTAGKSPMPPIASDTVSVHVVFCGKWHSFEGQYQRLVHECQNRFPHAPIVYSGSPTKKRTGWFEVYVDGLLIFSTKAGMGKYNTVAKKERVMHAIETALEKKKSWRVRNLSWWWCYMTSECFKKFTNWRCSEKSPPLFLIPLSFLFKNGHLFHF